MTVYGTGQIRGRRHAMAAIVMVRVKGVQDKKGGLVLGRRSAVQEKVMGETEGGI